MIWFEGSDRFQDLNLPLAEFVIDDVAAKFSATSGGYAAAQKHSHLPVTPFASEVVKSFL